MEAHEALKRHEEIAGGDEHAGISGLAQQAALLVAVTAAFLAIATFLGNTASNEFITAETKAADTTARLEANDTKTTIADSDAVLLRAIGGTTPEQKAAVAKAVALETRITERLAPIDRQLAEEIETDHHDRDHAHHQHLIFGLSEVALEIGIVLAGVAILARRRWLLGVGGMVAVLGVVLLGLGALS
jgi:hypothetical protein